MRESFCAQRRRGATLIELIVVMFLMSLMMISVGALMREGQNFYFGSIESLDLQKDALVAISRVSNELGDTNISSVRVYPDPQAADRPAAVPPDTVFNSTGIVFASPRDATGNFQFDSAGRIVWQTFVCYYVQTINGSPALVRKVTPIPPLPGLPPPPRLTPPDPDLEGRDLAYFQGSGDPTQMIGKGVVGFEATLLSDTVEVRSNSAVAGRYQFEFEVESTILPRN